MKIIPPPKAVENARSWLRLISFLLSCNGFFTTLFSHLGRCPVINASWFYFLSSSFLKSFSFLEPKSLIICIKELFLGNLNSCQLNILFNRNKIIVRRQSHPWQKNFELMKHIPILLLSDQFGSQNTSLLY